MKHEAMEVRDASAGYASQVDVPVVAEGYKQTEAGVIPEDWELLRFGDIFEFQNGVNADRGSYGQGIRFINVLEPISYSHMYGPEITGKVTLPETVAVPYTVKQGDILFNRTSETSEELGLASTYLGTERVVFGGFVIRGRPTGMNLDAVYAGYALRAPAIRKQIIPMGQGAIRTNIGQKNLSLVVASIPPLSEQRAIATALSDVDALLEALDRLIAKKRDIKQATMQQLLTAQTRLLGDWLVSDGYKQTEVGAIPEDWEECSLGEQVDILTGFPFPSDTYSSSGVRLLRGSNVKRGILDWSPDIARFWPEKATKLRQYELKESDLVIAMDGALVGRSYASLAKNDLPALLVQRVARLRSERVDQDLLKNWISSEQFVRHVDLRKTHTAIPHISPTDIREFKVAIPTDSNEQRAIATVLREMDTEREVLEQYRGKIATLKQAMMQELLTGRIRLVKTKPTKAETC